MQKYYKIILFLLVSSVVQAQKSTVDFRTRSSATLNLNLHKGWKFSTQYQVRFDENSSVYRGSYLYADVDKKILKYLSAGIGYRFALVGEEKFNRFSANIEGKYKFKNFTFSLRELYQTQRQIVAGDDEGTAESYLRSRLDIRYAASKKLDFAISAEPFVHKKDGIIKTDFWRNRVGVTYEYLKNKRVNLFYIWQPDVNKTYPDTKNILGINFIFDLKVK